EFFRVFFWHHNLDRGFGVEDKLRAGPWWYYGPHLLLQMLPWSLLLPAAAWSLWRRRDPDAGRSAAWLTAVVLLLSCVRFTRADSLLPALPGAVGMLPCAMARWSLARPSRRAGVAFAAFAAFVAAAWVGYVALVVPPGDEARTHRRFAAEVRRHTAGHVVFFRAEAHAVAFHVGRPMGTVLGWCSLHGLPA